MIRYNEFQTIYEHALLWIDKIKCSKNKAGRMIQRT